MATTQAKVDILKAEGNAAFSAENFEEAEQIFTQAIELDSTNSVLFSNRSAARAGLKNYAGAQDDAEKTIALRPDWPRGYTRLGAAAFFRGDYATALKAYEQAVTLDPTNETTKQDLRRTEEALSRRSNPDANDGQKNMLNNMFNEGLWDKIKANPSLAPYMNEPDFVVKMRELIANPSSLSSHLADERILKVLTESLNIRTPDGQTPPPTRPTSTPAPAPPRAPAKKAAPPEPVLSPEEQEAKKLREEGVAAYKAKNFSTALELWGKSMELKWDASLLNNIAAIYFEQGDFEKCIETCREAIQKGRESRVDFKVIARSFQRIGNAQVALKNYADALDAYKTSLTEHRTAETLEKLQTAEKLKKQFELEQYINPEIAAEEKAKGNQFFSGQDFPQALVHYNEAIKRNPTDHLLYSNRAACLTKLREWSRAIDDCDKCIKLKPDFLKGYTRKACVKFMMKDYKQALEIYEKCLEMEPTNQEVLDGIKDVIAAMNNIQNSDTVDEEQRLRAMQDPEIQNILQDPHMQQVMQQLQADPVAAQGYLKDPLVRQNLGKLSQAGIIKMSSGGPPAASRSYKA